jgi:enoyl-CoA hydratase/carnithine racemase
VSSVDSLICLEIKQHYAILRLSNPPLNVVSLPLTRALYAALRQLAQDDNVRAIILTGEGNKAFCAGSDILELEDLTKLGAVLERKLIFQNKVFEFLRDCPKPTIAALNGLTYGGGLEIAVCCDFIIAESQVRLALPEIKLGVFPSSGGTFRVARKIGQARAKEMIFLGEPIDASQGLAWGLVNRVVDAGQALTEAERLATQLANRSRMALAEAKAIVNIAFDRSDAEAISESLKASDRVFCSLDAKEGIAAFIAKRPPVFT